MIGGGDAGIDDGYAYAVAGEALGPHVVGVDGEGVGAGKTDDVDRVSGHHRGVEADPGHAGGRGEAGDKGGRNTGLDGGDDGELAADAAAGGLDEAGDGAGVIAGLDEDR